ncbi:MAG: thioredoxin family protein [Anaerolineaceae bacterium]|nr:thioredoxin family protein [Anaerolineaceae bacterium]
MPNFIFGKKETPAEPPNFASPQGKISVKVLGSGCSKCNLLEKHAKEALEEMGLAYELEHLRDYAAIARYGVMQTPALVVNEKVLLYGRAATRAEIKDLLAKR